MPVEKGRLMMLVVVGSRIRQHCFKRDVGIGSKSQSSSVVTQVKEEMLGGVNGRGE